MRFKILIIGILLSASAIASAITPVRVSGNDWRAALEHQRVENGKATLLSWLGSTGLDPQKMRIDFLNRKLNPFKHPKTGDTIWAIVPVSYVQGPIAAKVNVTMDSGKNTSLELPVEVIAGRYQSERIKVAKSKVELSDVDRQRTMRESAEVDAIYAAPARERIWEKEFILPVKSKITSPYGTQRLFNDVMQSFHSGLDLRAWTGTTIRAANAGTVVLAKDLFYSGNCVIIDHGAGIFTSYSHLSAFAVKVGDQVKQNQNIGKAGATGRVSAPHLHWGAKVASISIDPQVLLELSLQIVRNNTSF